MINVLFSDALAGDFVSIGDVTNRQMLDTGKAGNDELFWEKVQKTFIEPGNSAYNCLQFIDDEVFCDKEEQINPALIVNHNWKKLRTIWKSLNSDYKAALTRFTVSGTHDSNFFSFCNGKLKTYYYLRLHLEKRPELVGMVEADLPFECFIASEMSISEISEKVSGQEGNSRKRTSTSSTSGSDDHRGDCQDGSTIVDQKTRTIRKKRKTEMVKVEGGQSDESNNRCVADAIRDYGNSQMKAKVAKQKLHYMQNKDARRREKVLLVTWEKLSNNIRLLRKDFHDVDNALDLTEIQEEIEGLAEQKKELARELGIMKKNK